MPFGLRVKWKFFQDEEQEDLKLAEDNVRFRIIQLSTNSHEIRSKKQDNSERTMN